MCDSTDSNTVQQIHVIFRHGSRNPDKAFMYPKDPHVNDTWEPEGCGQLTKDGKMQVYNIGTYLRKRYDEFLGRIYTPNVIEAITTKYDRTKMSLQLVLAGLFPPTQSQTWNDMLQWQPIPYSEVPSNTEYMRFPLYFSPKYIQTYKELMNSDHIQNFYKNNADIIQYISDHSGVQNINNLVNLMKIYDTFLNEDLTGRELPTWSEKVYPEFFKDVIYLHYELLVYNDELKKLSGGYMLKKIINDMQAKQDGSLIPKERKIYLYSGHEFNLAFILAALNVFKIHMPPFAAYLIVELHLINNVYGVKILYQDYEQDEPKYLTIPGCDTFCYFDKFLRVTAPIIPSDTDV